TFRKEEPLDMRFDSNQKQKAQDIINKKSEEELKKILTEYGEEKYANSIASQIVKSREEEVITTTTQLVEIIREAVPGKYEHGKKHFATKTFQAIRIAVNDELENIKKGLRKATRVVEPEGRIVAISFHSLEDRIVKNFFKKKNKQEKLKILTKSPITPTEGEIKNNPQSRSAKLRAAKKL
ncbi:MAG: 16S rRNA (cytosine(1402)-N(4))-methyltransferase RsmH, partial [Candidatus Paceibacterota bacterium]